MVKNIELLQDRNLIKTNFDGYKLSLETIPIIKQKLNSFPHWAKAKENQYSFLHVQLFSLQNLLVQDQWNRNSSYYISENGSVVKCHYDDRIGKPSVPETVFNIPSNLFSREPGDYNCSLIFVSEKYCLICNGKETCILVDTDDRYKCTIWKEVFTTEISRDFKNFILKDARLDIIEDKKKISCVFQRIEYDGSSHFSQLFWCSLNEDNENWKFNFFDILCGKGSVLYCAFEPKAASIILSSNTKFCFKSTEKIIEPVKKEDQLCTSTDDYYSWNQTDKDVIIIIKMENGENKNDYTVKSTLETIQIENGKYCAINGKLFAKVDSELTIWTQENNTLKVTLTKQIPNNFWTHLIEGGPAEKNSFEDKPIANLEAPLEDCDFPINLADEEYFIERFHLDSKEVTHKILLGNSPPLFSTQLRPGFPPAFVNRCNVDASIWLQKYNPNKPDDWNFRHEGNLHALGYIQASKQQKKFMNCSPDLNFSVICESHRHVFIYKPHNDNTGGFRNRNGPQISIGKQHLVTLESAGEVLGMQCGTDFLILITETYVLYLQINSV